jgi:hypothetical protein
LKLSFQYNLPVYPGAQGVKNMRPAKLTDVDQNDPESPMGNKPILKEKIMSFGSRLFPSLAVCVGAVACVAVLSAQQQTRRGGAPTSESIGQAMVKALKQSDRINLPPLFSFGVTVEKNEEDAIDKYFAKAKIVAGEGNLTGQPALSVFATQRAYVISRRPWQTAKIAEYEARFDKIDKATIDAFRPDMAGSNNSGISTMLAIAIVFHDFLWEAGDWKKGNPQQAITRLKSVPATTTSEWKQVAKVGEFTEPEIAPWSLLAVNELFVNDVFQQETFTSALPIAKNLLAIRHH